MIKEKELFTSMSVGKAVAKLTIPTVVSQIIVILYSLADTFFIGQIGDPNQLTALGITFPDIYGFNGSCQSFRNWSK